MCDLDGKGGLRHAGKSVEDVGMVLEHAEMGWDGVEECREEVLMMFKLLILFGWCRTVCGWCLKCCRRV